MPFWIAAPLAVVGAFALAVAIGLATARIINYYLPPVDDEDNE